MHLLVVPCLLGATAFYLCTVRCLKHLVDCERTNRHDQLLKDGEPGGGCATEKDAPVVLRGIPGGLRALEWLVTTPDWAKRDPGAIVWLRRARSCVVVSLLFYVLFFLLLRS